MKVTLPAPCRGRTIVSFPVLRCFAGADGRLDETQRNSVQPALQARVCVCVRAIAYLLQLARPRRRRFDGFCLPRWIHFSSFPIHVCRIFLLLLFVESDPQVLVEGERTSRRALSRGGRVFP